MIERLISDRIERTNKSVLLLGPRQVGKSTLIETMNPDLKINLADESEFLNFSSNPSELKELIATYEPKTVFIDEIQRLPSLLNTIQTIVDSKNKIKFYLTGSSPRKLKRGGANLLPGRVLNYFLGPLVASELEYKIDQEKALTVGTLPEVYLNEDSKFSRSLLKSYTANYLSEEIKAEALSRNLEAFARFMNVSISESGKFIDYTKLAHKAKISRHSCSRYFEIFEDTLVGYRLFPLEEVIEKADLIKHPKFYFFDNGVYNAAVGNFTASGDRLGVLSEQLIFTQILYSSWAKDIDCTMSSFRTRGGLEVDFLLKRDGDFFGIEVKSHSEVRDADVASLLALNNYISTKDLFVFHLGKKTKKVAGVWTLPWQQGLQELGL